MSRFGRRSAAALLGLASAAFASVGAHAAELRFTVKGADGAPLPNAVVTVYPTAGGYAPGAPSTPLVMGQRDIAFAPYVLIAPVGAQVEFANGDKVRHHVYSFSAPHRFELKLFGREEHRLERFDKPGIVALGCNIHDAMAGYIDVVDTRFAAKTDALGQVRIADLPPGPAVVKAWHPLAKAPGGMVAKTVTFTAAGLQDGVTLELRPAPKGKQVS